MLASGLRSLLLADLGGPDGLGGSGAGAAKAYSPEVFFEVPLDGGAAVALDWDLLSERLAVAITGGTGFGDKITFVPVTGDDLPPEDVVLPAGAGVTDVSVSCREEDDVVFAAAACTDGALRLIDASPGAPPSIVRTAYSHGVAATAVRLSPDGRVVASGSASGHVVVQPFSGSPGASPLPGISRAEERDVAVTGLRYSLLRPDALAACDSVGHLQVWDARALRHLHRFPRAHTSAVRAISFSAQNSDLLISGGDDARLVFWDVNSGAQIREVAVESELCSLSYHADGYLLAAGTVDGMALVFDLRMLASKSTATAEPVVRWDAHLGEPAQQHRRGGPLPPTALRAIAFAPMAMAAAIAEDLAGAPQGEGAVEAPSAPAAEPRSAGRGAEAARGRAEAGAPSAPAGGVRPPMRPLSAGRDAMDDAAGAARDVVEADRGAAARAPAATAAAPTSASAGRPPVRGASGERTAPASAAPSGAGREEEPVSLAAPGLGAAEAAPQQRPQPGRAEERRPSKALPPAATPVLGSDRGAPALPASLPAAPVTPSNASRKREQQLGPAAPTAASRSQEALAALGDVPAAGRAAPGGSLSREAPPGRRVPAEDTAQRFTIAGGTPPDDKGLAASCSPWWSAVDRPFLGEDATAVCGGRQMQEPSFAVAASSIAAAAAAPAAGGSGRGAGASSGASAAALAEALGPMLEALKEDMRREIRESQCAVLEQSFKLNAELRKDVEELSEEVQRLRGELRLS